MTSCVVWGICSGAYTSYHAALAEPVVRGAMLLNHQLFRWREEEAADNIARNQAKSFSFYGRSALRLATWKRLFRGSVSLKIIVIGLAARLKKAGKARLKRFLGAHDSPLHDVERIARRGCRIYFVYSPEDIGLHELNTVLGPHAQRVSHLAGVTYTETGTDVQADHTFTSLPAQRWVKAWTKERLTADFPH